MGLTLTPNPDKQSKFIEVPVGTHLARCYQVIDCGMQLDPYTVGETKYKHKVALLFEVHGKDYAGNPLTVKNGETKKRYVRHFRTTTRAKEQAADWL
jgi:hypothetical protein